MSHFNYFMIIANCLWLLGCQEIEFGLQPLKLPPKPLELNLKYYNHFPFNHVYTTQITIQEQPIEVVVDTGSTNLLVLADSTLCSSCENAYGFDSRLKTKLDDGAARWSLNFQPIGSATASVAHSNIQVAMMNIPDQRLGVVTRSKNIPNIWGIAYPSLAKPSNEPQKPLLERIVEKAELPNRFAILSCDTRGASQIVIGGSIPNISLEDPSILWTPITRKNWYAISMTQFSVAGTTWKWKPSTSQGTIIVDNGTNPLVLPQQILPGLVNAIKGQLSKEGTSLPDAIWPTASSRGALVNLDADIVSRLPELVFEFPDAKHPDQTLTLKIPPKRYIQRTQSGQYFLGIEPAQSDLIILGTVFMEEYLVIHERGEPGLEAGDKSAMLGFYPSRKLCSGK